jgi:protein-tyrosine phosphatase
MFIYKDHDLSQITSYLYLSSWPEGRHRDEILERNIRLILCMHYRLPEKALRQPPLRLIWLPTIDSPLTPIPISFLQRGADEAVDTIQAGGAVLVHCKYGIHRSAAMACCVMIAMGYQAQAAMRIAKDRRPVADPYVPYIRSQILRFEQVWNDYE